MSYPGEQNHTNYALPKWKKETHQQRLCQLIHKFFLFKILIVEPNLSGLMAMYTSAYTSYKIDFITYHANTV